MNDLILKQAKEIVQKHLDRCPGIEGSYLSPNSGLDNILLVESDSDVATSMEVAPFVFSDMKLILLSPEEWEMG